MKLKIYIFQLEFFCLFQLLLLVLPLLPGRSRVLGVKSNLLVDFHPSLQTKAFSSIMRMELYLSLGWPEHGIVVAEPPIWHIGVVTV